MPPCLRHTAPTSVSPVPQQPQQRRSVVVAVLLPLGMLMAAGGAGRLLRQRQVQRRRRQQPDEHELLPLAHRRSLTTSPDSSHSLTGDLPPARSGWDSRGRQRRVTARLSTRKRGIQMLPMDLLQDVLAHQLGSQGQAGGGSDTQQHSSALMAADDAPRLAADGNRLASTQRWQLATESLRVAPSELQVGVYCLSAEVSLCGRLRCSEVKAAGQQAFAP